MTSPTDEKKADVLSSIVANMTLAHEMIMEDDFKLKHIEGSSSNSLEKVVHGIVHQAFWDTLASEINMKPPNYQHVFKIFMEMKSMLLEIIPKNSKTMQKEVQETLDDDLISKQINHNVFDIDACARFVLSTLSKLCAPVRDDKISVLKDERNIVTLLRGIMELINLMKMDMANYEIYAVKPVLVQRAVEYEIHKFEEYLKENQDGLKLTSIWIEEAYNIMQKQNFENIDIGVVVTQAYLSLLTPVPNRIFPETLLLDEIRLKKISREFDQLVYMLSFLTCSLNILSSHLQTDHTFVKKLKKTIQVLIGDRKPDEDVMERVYLQAICDAENECANKQIEIPFKCEKTILIRQLKDLLKEDNQIKKLIECRMKAYVELSINSQTMGAVTSSALLPIEDEIKSITSRFQRIVVHNKKVHYFRYIRIFTDLMNRRLKQEGQSHQNSR